MNKFDSIQRRAVRILFYLKRSDLTISIHSIMATLGWLQFRDLCKFRLLCITHKAIYMGVPSDLSKGLILRTTTRPSRKCELMKLSLPLVSSMQMLLSRLLLRSNGTVFPMTYAPYHHLLLLNVDYIHIW